MDEGQGLPYNQASHVTNYLVLVTHSVAFFCQTVTNPETTQMHL